MKRRFQIGKRKASGKLRSNPVANRGIIQMVLALAEVAERLRRGVPQMLFDAERELQFADHGVKPGV